MSIALNNLQVQGLEMKVVVNHDMYFHLHTGSLQSANLLTPENAVLGQSSVLTCEVHTSLTSHYDQPALSPVDAQRESSHW